jgi:hypothetical protein
MIAFAASIDPQIGIDPKEIFPRLTIDAQV